MNAAERIAKRKLLRSRGWDEEIVNATVQVGDSMSEYEGKADLNRVSDAVVGENGDDQRRIACVGVGLVATLLRKNADYGSSVFNPPVLARDLSSDATIRVRMSDKISRLSNLWGDAERQVDDETVEDTVKDLVAYGILWLARPDKRTDER